MTKINFFILLYPALISYFLGVGGEGLNIPEALKRSLLILSVILWGALRYISILSLFRKKGDGRGLQLTEIGISILSHSLLFSSLFILFRTNYNIPNSTNPVIDSLYFTSDILSTVGGSDIQPITPLGKCIETIHNLDAYLLLLLIGYEIIYTLRGKEVNTEGGSREKA